MGKPKIILRQTSMLTKKIGIMKKLFGAWNNNREEDIQRKANPQPVVKEGVPIFLNQTRGVRTTFTTRRQIVLNRHFTEIISDVLSVNLKKQLETLGVVITSIETKTWNKGVTVFYSTRVPFNKSLHMELNSLERQLRSAISERRLIGRTPHVNFVYDKTIQIDRALEHAISNGGINDPMPETSLVIAERNQLHISKNLGSHELKLISKSFSAPADMNNTMAGLSYAKFYDKVALRLERSRGEASQMMSNSGLLSIARPLFRAPREDQSIEDPTTRILRMKRFLVNQQIKGESMARKRRKEELLARDAYKWNLPDDEDDEQVSKDELNIKL